MRRLRAAALSEVELAMDIINQAKAHLRAQGIDQWQTGYPDRDCLEPSSSRKYPFPVRTSRSRQSRSG